MSENKYIRQQEICDALLKLSKEFGLVIMTATQRRSFNGDYNPPIKKNGLDLIIVDYADLIKEV